MVSKKIVTLFKVILLCLYLCSFYIPFAQPNSQKNITAEHYAVVTASPYASMAALDVMKKGGNAFDAAITAQWVLAVVYPQAGNIGGGGFMIAHTQTGKNICLDFREVSPEKSHKDMYLDNQGNLIPGLSTDGSLACGTPGSVAGIFAMHRFARLPMRILMQSAIEYAEKGFAISTRMANELNELKNDFIRLNDHQVAFVKNELWKPGDILIQPELAATLKRISKNGKKEFYFGETARHFVSDMQKTGGIISMQDLSSYKVKERMPMKFLYKGFEVVTMPLPSSGGIILKQLLTISQLFGLDKLGFHTASNVQLAVEAERRVYADRATYLGDPDFVKVPVDTLTSAKYLKKRMSDFQAGKAGSSQTSFPGNPYESEETTHLSVLDSLGNAVSVTTTLNDSYGSRRVVQGAGFILNNEMDDFSVKPGVPNLYGVTGGEANAIAPYKKMLSSMTPTIVLKNNHPAIVVGTPGGSTIPTSVFQTITQLIDHHLKPDEAVNNPKFHHQWTPDKIFIEKDFPKKVSDTLSNMGYVLAERGGIGRTELITIEPWCCRSVFEKKKKPFQKIKISAIADNRGDDDARGD